MNDALQQTPTRLDAVLLWMQEKGGGFVRNVSTESIESQVQMLRATYLMLLDHGLLGFIRRPNLTGRSLTAVELALHLPTAGAAALVHNVSLYHQLARLGKFTQDIFGFQLPRFKRICFYRNKVAEHWNDYAMCRPGMGSFAPDRAVVFGTCTEGDPEKRQECRTRIEALLSTETEKVDLERFGRTANGFMAPDYADEVFCALERIDPKLRFKPPNHHELICLLFRFGLPLPIRDLESYLAELADCLKAGLCGKEGRSIPRRLGSATHGAAGSDVPFSQEK